MAIKNVSTLFVEDLDDRNKLVVDHDEINGRNQITFRVWYLDASGEWRAGRNGFNVNPEVAQRMLKAVKVPTEALKEKPKPNGEATSSGRKF